MVPEVTSAAECTSLHREDYFGVGLGADRLANLEVGNRGRQVSYRFHAAYSAPIESVRVFIKTGPGYSAGDGGVITAAVQTDDGTAAHAPSGHVLGSVTANRVAVGPFNRLFRFEKPSIPLESGALYHLVFTNVGPAPGRNFVSVNDLESLDEPAPMAKHSAEALTKDAGDVVWSEHVRHIPVFAIEYSNGCRQGQGYMDALSRSAVFQIGGAKRVRETVRVNKTDHVVKSVSVRIRRAPDTTANLEIRLVDAGRGVLAQGALDAAKIPTDYRWVTYNFPTAQRLRPGRTYYLEVSSIGRFETFPLESGIAYGFDVPSVFRDGEYQTNDGRGWKSDSRNLQMQFYFTSPMR